MESLKDGPKKHLNVCKICFGKLFCCIYVFLEVTLISF